VLTTSSPPRREHGYGAETVPLAIAHRGGAAMGPENTVPAFERALALGYRYLETDVRATSDGVCVAFHDRALRRVTGRPGRVDELTWAEVRALRVGGTAGVPRLEDLLTAWPEARWALDVKQPSALPALVRIVRRAGAAHRVCLTGTWDRWLLAGREALGPAASTALGWRSAGRLLAGADLGAHGADFVHLPLRLVGRRVPTAAVVDRAHRAGLRVVIWGVAVAQDMHRLLDDGVDGIFTDHTDVLREVLIARGDWRAPVRQRDRRAQADTVAVGTQHAAPAGSVPASASTV
jgi:glycerophosphoryl diester phosphodiesterase